MRRRPAAKIIVVDDEGRVLLLRFVHRQGAVIVSDDWSLPGGAVDPGETFEQAAIRELFEETGIVVTEVGPVVGTEEFDMTLMSGENVLAEECFYLVRVDKRPISNAGWSPQEKIAIAEHRWWSADEIAGTNDTIWPKHLLKMMGAA